MRHPFRRAEAAHGPDKAAPTPQRSITSLVEHHWPGMELVERRSARANIRFERIATGLEL